MGDRERPKKSWKEIDAAREGGRRSSSSSGEGNARNAAAEAKASSAHRAALDALFERGEIGKYAEKLGLGPPTHKPQEPAKAAAPAPAPSPEAIERSAKDEERQSLRKKILEGSTRESVARAFDRYAKAYGLPTDWELLERGLEHPRDQRLSEVMGGLEKLLATEKPRRVRTLDGRLRLIAETHEDPELRARAESIRKQLS